jgi:hypothetical protein
MKKNLITAMLLSSAGQGLASTDVAAAVADVTLTRPVCFALTVAGSGLFVLALPFAAASHSVKETANLLVVKPAKATFTRPVGDLDALKN